MFVTVLSTIGSVIAVSMLLLMAASSALPDLLDRFWPSKRRAAGENTQRSQVSLLESSRHNGDLSGPTPRTAAELVRRTGSRPALPAGHSGSLPG